MADILPGLVDILHRMAGILSGVPGILHVQHKFLKILEFSKGKIHFFPKVLKNWSSCQKMVNTFFLGGGVRAKSDKFT